MRTQFKPKLIALAVLSIYAAPSIVVAEETALQTETIEVISNTPLKGIGLSRDVIPSNIQTIEAEDIENQNNLSIADVLKTGINGVNVNEVQNNPFQPNVNYRGFTASPLLGTPQGLSVFVDGVRVNEVFGDVVSWDLIPLNAISNISLIPGSNPVFGLNTLGGALSVQTKSGRTDPGGAIQLLGGSWGRAAAEAEYGAVSENGVDIFIAANVFREQGWRDFSPSDVRQVFGKIGWQGENTDANLSLTIADNQLVGNGFVQREFLSGQSYDAINTKPDLTDNEMAFLNFNLNHYFNDTTVFSGNTYYRYARTITLNGDGNDDIDPDDPGFDLANCVPGADEDDAEISCSGALNRTRSNRDSYGFNGQFTFSDDLFGKKNQFIVGGGYDRGNTNFFQSGEFGTLTANRGVNGVGVFGDEGAVELSAVTQTFSTFLTDTISLTDIYHLTMSARYNYTKVDNSDKLVPFGDPTSLTESFTFNRVNPAIGLSVTPSKDFSFYGSYNEGSRAPTAIELGCAFQDLDGDGLGDTPCRLPNALAGDPPLDQVVSKTFETGVRGKLANNLGYTLSVYRSKNHDDIQFISSRPNSGAGNFLNVGETLRQGLDLGLNGTIGSKFNWNLGYSYVRATYESTFKIASEVNSSAIDEEFRVSPGDQLPGIPNHQLRLRGEWQATPNWVIGSNILAFSDQYSFGNENNNHQGEGAKTRGYAIMNLDTRYIFGNSGWEAFGRLNNLFDKEYFSAGLLGETLFNAQGVFQGGDDEGSFLVAPGAPRAAWVGVRYTFGGKKSLAGLDVD
jgi:outer membrane receptor protein involved in Fe transport